MGEVRMENGANMGLRDWSGGRRARGRFDKNGGGDYLDDI